MEFGLVVEEVKVLVIICLSFKVVFVRLIVVGWLKKKYKIKYYYKELKM